MNRENLPSGLYRCDNCGELTDNFDLVATDGGNKLLVCRACQEYAEQYAKDVEYAERREADQRAFLLGATVIGFAGIAITGAWWILLGALALFLIGSVLRGIGIIFFGDFGGDE